jgi:hypothetical protein
MFTRQYTRIFLFYRNRSYRSADQAKRAIVELNGRFIGKKPIVVMLHIKKEQRRLQKQLMHETIGPSMPHAHGYNSHHGPVGPMTGPLREQMYLQQQVLLGMGNGGGRGGGSGPVGPMGYGYPNQRGNPALMRGGMSGGGMAGRGMEGRGMEGRGMDGRGGMHGGYYESGAGAGSGYDRNQGSMQHHQQQQHQQQRQQHVMDEHGDALDYDHLHQMRKQQQQQQQQQDMGMAAHRGELLHQREEIMIREEMRMLQRMQEQQKRVDGSQGLGQGPALAPSLTSLLGPAGGSNQGLSGGRFGLDGGVGGDRDGGYEASVRMLSKVPTKIDPSGNGHSNGLVNGNGNGSGSRSGSGELDAAMALAAVSGGQDGWLGHGHGHGHGSDMANSLLGGLGDDANNGLSGFLPKSTSAHLLAVAPGPAPLPPASNSPTNLAVGSPRKLSSSGPAHALILPAEPARRRQLLIDALQPLIAQHKPFLARALTEFLVDSASPSELCDCLDSPALLVPHYISVALGLMKMPVFTDTQADPAPAPAPGSTSPTTVAVGPAALAPVPATGADKPDSPVSLSGSVSGLMSGDGSLFASLSGPGSGQEPVPAGGRGGSSQ